MSARVSRAFGASAVVSVGAGKLTFGTRSAEIVFGKSTGTRTLLGYVVVDLSGASLTQERILHLHLRRVNHTSVNVPASAVTVKLGLNSGSGESGDIHVSIPACTYTLSGQAGDHVVIWASLDSLNGVAGEIKVREAQITAL